MDVMKWAEIHRLKKTEELSNKAIARHLGCCHKTVAKALNMIEPPLKPQKRSSILDPFKEQIDSLMEVYPLLSALRVHQEVVRSGFKGEITTVRRYLRKIRPVPNQKVFLETNFEPAEAIQVDWGECNKIKIGEYSRKLYVFVAVLCYSRLLYIEFSLSQKKEDFYRCIVNTLNFMGGSAKKIIVDNLKAAVVEGAGKTARFHPEFLTLCNHYLIQPIACAARNPQAKGMVESAVKYVKVNALAGYDEQLNSIDQYHQHAKKWRDEVANLRIHSNTRKRPIEVFEEKEKACLRPLPKFDFDTDIIIPVVASPTARISFDCNKYSVPALFARKALTLRADQRQIMLFDGIEQVAWHKRSYEKGKVYVLAEHHKEVLALRKRCHISQTQAEFDTLGIRAQEFRLQLEKCPLRPIVHMRRIIKLATIYGNQEIMEAICKALEFNAIDAAYVENILQQQRRKRNLPSPTPLCPVRKELIEDVFFDEPNPSEYDDLFGTE